MNPCNRHFFRILRYPGNELTPRERSKLLAHVEVCARCREYLEKQQMLSQLLRQSRPLYRAPDALRGRVAALLAQPVEPVPERRDERIMRLLQEWRGRTLPLLRWKVLAPSLLAIGAVLFFVSQTVTEARAASYVNTAVLTHTSYVSGALPLSLRSDSSDTVTTWLAGKLPFHFELPGSTPLSQEGRYRLTGASLIDYQGTLAAFVTWQNPHQKVSLIVASGSTAAVAGGEEVQSKNLTFHYHTRPPFRVVTWSSHGLSYALVSSTSRASHESCMVCHQDMRDHGASLAP